MVVVESEFTDTMLTVGSPGTIIGFPGLMVGLFVGLMVRLIVHGGSGL